MSDLFTTLTFTVPTSHAFRVCAAVGSVLADKPAQALTLVVNNSTEPKPAEPKPEPKPTEIPLPPGVAEFAAAQATATATELVEQTLGQPAPEKRKPGRPRKPAAVEGVPNEPAMAATPPKPKPAPLTVVKSEAADDDDPFGAPDEPATAPTAAATPPTVTAPPAPGEALELLKQTMSAYVRAKGLPGLQKAFAAMGYKVLSDVPESAYGVVVDKLRKDIGA